jgi:hypothetical protein
MSTSGSASEIYIFGPLAFSGSTVVPADTSSVQTFDGDFTGSLYGTASYADKAGFALYAETASFILFTTTASIALHLDEQTFSMYRPQTITPTYTPGGFFYSSSGDWYLS